MSSKDISYLQLWWPFCYANWIELSLTKFVRFAIDLQKIDAVSHFIFKTYPSVIPGFVAYLIKYNALNDLCG